MSDSIPFEIQSEIMKRLPVKSLLQFRSVSKPWKSLIDSADFIKHYDSQMQHLLVRYARLDDAKQTYVSIVDDDTFPRHKVSVTIPPLVNWLKEYSVIGCSHGLLCLFGDHREGRRGPLSGTGRVVLWNLSIRKALAVVVPNVADGYRIYRTVLGFGVCRETTDPKIVKITQINRCTDVESINCIPWHVQVFKLSTRAWRRKYCNLPRKSLKYINQSQVVVDGVLYLLATDMVTMDGRFYNMIISFDMTSEEFREINLPNSLVHEPPYKLYLFKLRESLVLLKHCVEDVDVWMMEDGVSKSFTRIFTVNAPNHESVASVKPKGFRKTSEPIIELIDCHGVGQLAVYEPDSKQVDELGIVGVMLSFSVYPYTETLLLLDQPNRTVRN